MFVFFNHYFISLHARNPEMTAESLLLVFQPIPFFFLFKRPRREFLSARLNLNTVSSAGSVRPGRFFCTTTCKRKKGVERIFDWRWSEAFPIVIVAQLISRLYWTPRSRVKKKKKNPPKPYLLILSDSREASRFNHWPLWPVVKPSAG